MISPLHPTIFVTLQQKWNNLRSPARDEQSLLFSLHLILPCIPNHILHSILICIRNACLVHFLLKCFRSTISIISTQIYLKSSPLNSHQLNKQHFKCSNHSF
ncbi:hypothetical protein AAHE18_04G209100 [Arachis hypogaea]